VPSAKKNKKGLKVVRTNPRTCFAQYHAFTQMVLVEIFKNVEP